MSAEAAAIPGYAGEWRFDDTDVAAWDSDDEIFLDLAGYGLKNAIKKITGTPSFSAQGANSRRCLRLDNSCHWRAFPAFGWQGTLGVIARPVTPSASVTLNCMTIGLQSSVSSNGRPLYYSKSSGVLRPRSATGGSVLVTSGDAITSGNIAVTVNSWNQADRSARSTSDGVTVNAVGPATPAAHGNGVAVAAAAGSTPTDTSRGWLRIGNNNGTLNSTTQNVTDYVDIFEMCMWIGDQLSDNLALIEDWIVARKTYYGIA